MKNIINFTLLAFAFLSIINPASALSCMFQSTEQHINNANTIFVGKVLNVDNEKATFEISKYWKGELNQNQLVYNTTYWTGYPGGNVFFKVGETYVVYANRNANNVFDNLLRAEIDCSRTSSYALESENQITNYLGIPRSFQSLVPNTLYQNQRNYCAFTNLNSNLYYGNFKNNRDEVRILQNFLFNYYDVIGEVNATGYFGKLTKSYVAQFQREFGISKTGGVGALTRNKIKEICNGNINENGLGGGANCKVYYDGCNTCSRQYPGGPQMCTLMACIQGGDAAWFAANKPVCREYFNNNNVINAPVINSFTGPVKLNINEKGTWKIDASVYNNQALTYNITWGDENYYDYARSFAPNYFNSIITQNSTFEHSYSRTGTFTVTIEVKTQDGQTAKATQAVLVQNQNTTLNPESNGQCKKWTDSYGSECRRDYVNGPTSYCFSWTARYAYFPNLTPICTEFF